ncbi:zinc phosphodiesterase ELAC protein 2 [Elysia marginata]|uniref:Zinc phosphodiesterase ELAC protein 2 n=1 Tax=Elysia marginata TaxID=1093978 RepID=A0AAV4I3N7_9GAST|nr:zinc phosphodiesterase ELAC protein 2 [Elysia marginata]
MQSKKKKEKVPAVSKKVKPMQTKVPSTVNIVVIGTGGPGTSHSLLVTTETTRYMFNCGEGTQRLAAMSKGLRAAAFAKLSGLENIFITHKSWENTGGLLGLSMTLESQLNPESKVYMAKKAEGPPQKPTCTARPAQITIHGPPGVEKIALMARKFSESANLDIVKSEGTFSDAALSVHAVPFYNDSKEVRQVQETEPVTKKFKKNEQTLPETSVAYAYICQPKPALGKINVEKCLDAGITIGPMVGKLQRGETVTLENGTVVRPEQVLDAVCTERRPFLIIECPSLSFMPSLSANSDISPRMTSSGEDSFALVVHMSSEKVFRSEEYQEWMSRFSGTTKHLVLNRSAEEADLIRVRTHQAMLNLVSQDIFPILPSASARLPNGTKDISSESTVFATSGMHYVYRGKDLGFQFSSDEFDHAETQKSCLNDNELREQLEALNQSQTTSSPAEKNGTHSRFPTVVFLGTGSSEPNRIRGQSCIVVELSADTVIILDCGEDSFGQLHRFYGGEEAKRILQKVKAIFVSHMHGDHHLGLFTLLKERKNAFAVDNIPFSPVFLLSPIQMRRWLRFYHHEMESLSHLLRFVKHQTDMKTFADNFNLPTATVEDVKQKLQLEEYEAVAVDHCKNAFGVVFKHKTGCKMVYSGDTRPCDNLVEAGMDCDILIHEATHEDALIAHAKASKHSTFSEAMDVGRRMKAKHVILTHFSQRYPHMVPLFDMQLPENVGIAFDNMQVCPKVLDTLPRLISPLTTLFSEKLQHLEIKRIKRTREQAENQAQQIDLPTS